MLIAEWYHIPTWLSLVVIVIVLSAAIGFSLKADRSSSNDGDASRH
jgi:tellurite resistance protein TerC